MANCAPGSVDIVIVDSTDPVGPAEGLFNKAFYASCFRALKDDGILVQQSESPLVLLDLIKEMRGEMGKAGFTTFKTLPFPQPCYPTGWWTARWRASPGGFEFREADARAKAFDTKYYSADIHRGALVAAAVRGRRAGRISARPGTPRSATARADSSAPMRAWSQSTAACATVPLNAYPGGYGLRLIRGDVLRALRVTFTAVARPGLVASCGRAGPGASRCPLSRSAPLRCRPFDRPGRADRTRRPGRHQPAGNPRDACSALDACGPQDDALRELRLRGFRCDYDDLGPPASGLAFARAGISDALRLRDVGSQIRFGLCEANYIDGSGQITQSLVSVEAALGLARKHNEPRLLAQSLIHRGGVRSLLGEQAAALSDFLEAQRVYTNAGLKKEAEASLQDIAVAYRRMGDHDKAMEYLRQSVAFAERERYWGVLSVSLLQTAFLHEDRGRYDEALAMQRRALQVASEQAWNTTWPRAPRQWPPRRRSAATLMPPRSPSPRPRGGFDRLGDRSNEGMLQLLEGQVHAGRGDHAAALPHFDARRAPSRPTPTCATRWTCMPRAALSHEALGDYRAALNDLKLERTGRQKLNDDARTQQSLLLQYQFDTARRDLENARCRPSAAASSSVAHDRARNRWQLAALSAAGLLVALLLFLLLRQLRSMRRINALALTDTLTGVANRRHIETAAERRGGAGPHRPANRWRC